MKECFIVLNRRVITSALIILTSLSGQPIKADATQQAQFDANEDVKRAKPIDEESLVNHDEEYIDAYLTVQAKFINRIAPAAQQIGREYDLYPSIIIAQAALESDWGCSTLGKAPNNNLFGVKGYFARQTVAQPTTEYDEQGHKLQVVSNFRQYASEYEA